MRSKIAAYERGGISLHSLIEDLRGLLDALEGADEPWRQDAYSKWGDLEVVFAVAADRAEQQGLSDVHLTDEEQSFVTEVVRALDQILSRERDR